MNFRCFALILLFSFHQNFSQTVFDPNERINQLSGKRHSIGLTAGYSVKGVTKWSGAAGFSCKPQKTEFSTVTLTRTASIAKSFTAVAVMQLVEKGLLDLDEPIKAYLPNLPEDKHEMTMRQLLGHTASISQYYGDKEFENKKYFSSLDKAMEVFINRPPTFEPGTGYLYSSYGYVVIGRIMEEITGMSYEDYMQKHIFDVAQMTATGVEYSYKTYENKSCLYHKKRRKARKAKANDLSNRVPGGGLYSTLEDVLKFGNALLDEKFISLESISEMTKYQDVEYDDSKYGLGWFLYGPSPNQELIIGHSGGQTGCTAQLLIVPETKTVAVVLSNTSNVHNEVYKFASDLVKLSEYE